MIADATIINGLPNNSKFLCSMTAPLVSFERQFQIWKYTVGHATLLLRSTKNTKNAQHRTQVDVLFKSVDFVSLPTTFDGLTITEVTLSEFEVLGFSPRKDCKFFRLEGTDWHGAVACGVVAWDENEKDFHDDSKWVFLPCSPRSGPGAVP